MSDVLLGDVAQVVDCEHKTAPEAPPGCAFAYSVGTPALRGSGIDFTQAKPVDEATYRGWSRRAELVPGDLILAREAPVGGVGFIDGSRKVCLGQRTVLVRAKRELIEPRFLFYLLRSPGPQAWMDMHSEGSTVRHLNVADVRRIALGAIPPLEDQLRIAGVLDALDDLIEVNRALVADLDKAVRLLGLAMLSGARERPLVSLVEIADVTKGYSYKSSELVSGDGWLVNLKNIGRSGTFEARGFKPLTAAVKEHQIVVNGDVLVAQTDLTQDREVIARPVRVRRGTQEGRLVASLDLAIVRPRAPHTNESIYAILDAEDFRSHALGYCNGTTVLHMGARAFPDYMAPVLTQEEIENFTARVRPLREAADALNIEISEVEATRNELLPLLMSGRVRVAQGAAA